MTERRTVAEWTERPFTDYQRRGQSVHHRVIVEHEPGVGTDVRHQVRSSGDNDYPEDWTDATVYEGRPHGLEVVGGD